MPLRGPDRTQTTDLSSCCPHIPGRGYPSPTLAISTEPKSALSGSPLASTHLTITREEHQPPPKIEMSSKIRFPAGQQRIVRVRTQFTLRRLSPHRSAFLPVAATVLPTTCPTVTVAEHGYYITGHDYHLALHCRPREDLGRPCVVVHTCGISSCCKGPRHPVIPSPSRMPYRFEGLTANGRYRCFTVVQC